MDEQEKKALLNQIRARSVSKPEVQDVIEAESQSNKQRRRWQPKHDNNAPLSAEEVTKQFGSYIRNVKLVGPIDKRNRRTVELAQIEQKLRDGEHVQNRTLQTWLTEAEYAEIDEAWQQQQRMRSGSKSKPNSIKDYEAMLKRAQFYDGKAAGEEARGHVAAANRSYLACQNELSAAVIYLQERSKSDPAFITWLDRSIPADIKNVQLSDMPRSITSTGKDVRVQRLSKSEVKTAVVQAALQRLVNGTD